MTPTPAVRSSKEPGAISHHAVGPTTACTNLGSGPAYKPRWQSRAGFWIGQPLRDGKFLTVITCALLRLYR